MTPSERIRFVKEIAHRLAKEEWPLIDLTLKTFSLPWRVDWSGDTTSYLLEMLHDAPDDSLIPLARHVGYEEDARRAEVQPTFWTPGLFRLFITHLAAYRRQASDLQLQLRKYHISAFVAHKDIEPTNEWQAEIELALATADGMAALLREGFHLSNWTDQEMGYAMGRNMLVIGVRLGQDPYGFMGRFQALDGTDKKVAVLAQEIFDILRRHKQSRKMMSRAVLAGFEQSYSFADAKENIGYLEETTYWDESFPTRLLAAGKANSQVSGAFGVLDRVKRLARRWERERA